VLDSSAPAETVTTDCDVPCKPAFIVEEETTVPLSLIVSVPLPAEPDPSSIMPMVA